MKTLRNIIIVVLLAAVSAWAAGPTTLNLRYDKYYTVQEVSDALQMFAKKYPDKVQVETIGQTFGKRPILALTLHNPKTGKMEQKPGYLVEANIHGNEIQGTEVTLYIIDYLLSNYGSDPFATHLVDTKVFYFIPIVNVDGRDRFFRFAQSPNTGRESINPIDDDRDGLIDEDDVDDLDGDGNICMMRIKDPNGRWKTDPKDPRLMVRCREDEAGEYTMLDMEGLDNDGDGEINEDGMGGFDMNRTFAFNWQPRYVEGGTSDYPGQTPNTTAIVEFAKKHPNILFFQDFHNFGGMILRGPGAKNFGANFLPPDADVYDYLGKEGEKILPGYKYMVTWKDLYTVYGGTDDFFHYLLGAFSFCNELYTGDPEYGKEKAKEVEEDGFMHMGDEAARLKWSDRVLMGQGYVPWHKVKHPKYGEVEVGGWAKFTTRMPHPFQLTDLCHRNAAFILFTASQMPEISVHKQSVTKVGDNLYRVRVALKNNKIVPSRTYTAVRNNIGRPDILSIEGVKVIGGGQVFDLYDTRFQAKEKNPAVLEIRQVGGMTTQYYEWLVEGSGTATVRFSSEKGGVCSETISVQ